MARTIILKWALEKEGLYWIVSPTYKQSKMIHWGEMQKEIPPELIKSKNEVELSFTLVNGSKIELRGAENPDTLRGVKLRGLVIDEIASIRDWDWLWKEVLMATLIDYSSPAIFISTPKGYNHFYRLFQLGLGGGTEYISFKYTSYDNPFIPKESIDLVKASVSEDTFFQEYMADFRKYEGLVYKDFEYDTHVVKKFDIPEGWERFRAFDFGSTNPTVCLWIAVDNDNNWFVYREHYESEKPIDYHAGIINANSSERISASYGDPSGAVFIKEYGERGVYITPAKRETNSTESNWVRAKIGIIQGKLRSIPGRAGPYPISTGESRGTGKYPSLFVFDDCTNTIKEFETYSWKKRRAGEEQGANEIDMPEKYMDHCFVGDTKILTKGGWKRIDTIKAGEYVWSPFGWNEVYRAGFAGVKKIKDYGFFECTPDHKILTSRGLVEVDKLRYSDSIMLCTKPLTFREFLTDATRMPKIELIGFTFNALLTKSLMARRVFYTEMYGNSIGGKFLTVIWYIILMGILPTTLLIILLLSLLESTLRNTVGVIGMAWKSTLRTFGVKQSCGTDRRKVGRGIKSTEKNHGKTERLFLKNVVFVGKNLKHTSNGRRFVAMFVRPQLTEEKSVYNLATRFGMYFANGVLVSNSLDALSYFACSFQKNSVVSLPDDTKLFQDGWY